MFTSNYLPVNMQRPNCAIYSNEKNFPEERLLEAYTCITGTPVSGVVLQDGVVSFIDDPSIQWTLAEIYCAYEAYKSAAESNFSYYTVTDHKGIPQLFVSKAFKGCRILVNAFNLHTVLLTDKVRVDKVASMIDRKATLLYCNDLFNTMSALESGSGKFLPAVLVNRDTSDEYMYVSPMTAIAYEVSTIYGIDVIEEMRQILDNPNIDTPSFHVDSDKLYRKDSPIYKPLPMDFVKYLVSLYDKLKAKKNNYIELNNENYEVELFYSTNQRYLINAKTFECVVIKNQHTKQILSNFASKDITTADQLHLVWMLAKTE